MKMVSMVAIAAAMLSVAAPAAAQRNKKPAEPQLSVSAEFRTPAAAAETAIKASDWATAETQLSAAEAVAKNDDERYFAAAMRLPLEVNKKNNNGIARALDTLLASPKTPEANRSYYNFLRGTVAFQMKKPAEAIPFLLKARELGNTEEDLTLQLAQAYVDTGKVNEGVAEMGRAIDAAKAAGKKPQQAWFNYAVAKTYAAGDRAATAVWLMRQVKEYPTVANWRKVLVLYRDSVDRSNTPLDRAQRIDLFRLMRATGALADQQDFFDYAKASVDAGLPWEAVAVIDEGRKAGTVPAASADINRAYTAAQTAVRGEGSLDGLARDAAKAADGRGAVATGDAFLASGNNARALELYDLALQKGGVNTDAVNLHKATALFHLGRKDEAKATFALVRAAPLSDIAGFWVAWLDMPVPLAA